MAAGARPLPFGNERARNLRGRRRAAWVSQAMRLGRRRREHGDCVRAPVLGGRGADKGTGSTEQSVSRGTHMLTAITRVPSNRLPECELSFLERRPIDVAVARAQHRAYQGVLRTAGAHVVELPALDDLPDATFVEDSALVFDEVAIVAPMVAASRRPETDAIAGILSRYRDV